MLHAIFQLSNSGLYQWVKKRCKIAGQNRPSTQRRTKKAEIHTRSPWFLCSVSSGCPAVENTQSGAINTLSPKDTFTPSSIVTLWFI